MTVAPSEHSDHWSQVSSPDSQKASSACSAKNARSLRAASDCSSVSSGDDLQYHFKQMRVPSSSFWATEFRQAGYGDMDELAEADLPTVFAELQVPSGIQKKIEEGMGHFSAGTFNATYMPQGDLDATAPVQSKDGINWWLWGGIAVGGLASVVGCWQLL